MGLRLRGSTSLTALNPRPEGKNGERNRKGKEGIRRKRERRRQKQRCGSGGRRSGSWSKYERRSCRDEDGEQVRRERHWSDPLLLIRSSPSLAPLLFPLAQKRGGVSGGTDGSPQSRAPLEGRGYGALVSLFLSAGPTGRGRGDLPDPPHQHYPSGNVRRRSSRSPLIARMRSDSSCTAKSVASSSTPLRFSFFFAPAIV